MDSKRPGEKQYGLIIPSKKGARFGNFGSASTSAQQPRASVFNEDSSSDDNLEKDEEESKESLDWRSRTVAKAEEKSMQRNQARQAALKALAEDPTIFQYDEVYDEMEQKKAEQKPVKEEKKPKYIANLLRTAEHRKVEFERRTERKVQKERESEGDMFQDKESFVTPAYRAKLAELKKAEEEESRRERIEEYLDVTKQRDMSGFYRHLYRQTFDQKPEVKEEKEETDAKEESQTEAAPQKTDDHKNRRHYRQRREESPEPAPTEPRGDNQLINRLKMINH
nr:EOG090X0D2W [Sida crystallina]